MLVLAFDTATAAVTTALSEWTPGAGARVLATADSVDRRHAELLAPSIAGVLAEAGADVRDLAAIVVGVGPGPYTGLRVGLVTARAMGESLGLPVHGVCTLDAIAWESRRTTPFEVATDARRKEIYRARYASYAERLSGPEVGPPGETDVPVLGEGAALYPAVLGEPGEPLRPSAAAFADLAVTRLNGGPGLPLLPPEPLYLRRPDANVPGPRKKVSRA